MAGPYYKWTDDFTQSSTEEIDSDETIKAIFDEMQGVLYDTATFEGFKRLTYIAGQLEQFINSQVQNIFTELVTTGTINVNERPKFVSDYGYQWPELSSDYKKLKKRHGFTGGDHFFFLTGGLYTELKDLDPTTYMGGASVKVYTITPGYRLNAAGQLINSGTGRYVKYERISYTIEYSFLGRAFQFIEDGIPPELTLPRTISKKLLGNRRAGKTKTWEEVNQKTLKWENKSKVINTPTELQNGAVRPMLMPFLYWFEKNLETLVQEKLGTM